MHKEDRPIGDEDTGLLGRILRNAARIDDHEKRFKAPTQPFYDSTNFPDKAVHGQIVVDKDDPSVIWVYGKDDQWHQIGGGLQFGIASYNSWDTAPIASNTDVPYDAFAKTPGGPFSMTSGKLHVTRPGTYEFRTTCVFRGGSAPSGWTVGLIQFATGDHPSLAVPANLLYPEPYIEKTNTIGTNFMSVTNYALRIYGAATIFPTDFWVWASYSGFAPSRVEVSTMVTRLALAI
jgi:hypothetical protein